MDQKPTVFDLLRHGEPEGGRRYRGCRDDPLSPAGWREMEAAVGGGASWGAVITSPLSRCRAFAERLAVARELPWQMEEGLREIDFGDWEGRSGQEVYQDDRERLLAFWGDPVRNPPPGGESWDDFQTRTTRARVRILEEFCGLRLLVITHGGVIRALVGEALGTPVHLLGRIQIDYASCTRINYWSCQGAMVPSVAYLNLSSPLRVSPSPPS